MAAQLAPLMEEARSLGLFEPHDAFRVHCSNCHSRLDPQGDCPRCGLIGRSEADLQQRAANDPAGTEKLLRGAIEKRRSFSSAKR